MELGVGGGDTLAFAAHLCRHRRRPHWPRGLRRRAHSCPRHRLPPPASCLLPPLTVSARAPFGRRDRRRRRDDLEQGRAPSPAPPTADPHRALTLARARATAVAGATAPEPTPCTLLIGLPSHFLWTIVPSRPHTLSLLHPISDHPPHAQPPVEHLTERPCRCARPLLTLLTSPQLLSSDLTSPRFSLAGRWRRWHALWPCSCPLRPPRSTPSRSAGPSTSPCKALPVSLTRDHLRGLTLDPCPCVASAPCVCSLPSLLTGRVASPYLLASLPPLALPHFLLTGRVRRARSQDGGASCGEGVGVL